MNTMQARKTVYKGVEMRSRLEAGYAAWLDRWKFEWEYEPCVFAGEHGQYLPDFRLRGVMLSWSDRPVTVYVEVKPEPFLYENKDAVEALSRKVSIVRLSDADSIALLQAPMETPVGMGIVGHILFDGDLSWPLEWIWAGKGHNLTLGMPLKIRDTPWHGDWWNG